jgi:hypothetical protein
LIRDMVDHHESLHVLSFLAYDVKAVDIRSWSPAALVNFSRLCRLAFNHCVSMADVVVSVLMTDGTSTLDIEQLLEYSPSLIGISDGL